MALTPWWAINNLDSLEAHIRHGVESLLWNIEKGRAEDDEGPTHPTEAEIAMVLKQLAAELLPSGYREILWIEECDHCERGQ
jgi:hypothetical protein